MKKWSTEYEFEWKNDTTVVCRLTLTELSQVFKGVARFHPEEDGQLFNERAGCQIAMVRAQKKAYEWHKRMLEREIAEVNEIVAQAEQEIQRIDDSNVIFHARLKRTRARMNALKK